VKYVRRLLWFVASKVLIVSLVVVILVFAFYYSMDAANIYTLLGDGLKQRTSVILTRQDPEYLKSFFRNEFLNNDEPLRVGLSQSSPYLNYKITGFDSSVTLESVWSWPWSNTATATVTYRVSNITGAPASGAQSADGGALPANPPAWATGRYTMGLIRQNGQWKIASMQQTQVLVDPTPSPHPTVSATAGP